MMVRKSAAWLFFLSGALLIVWATLPLCKLPPKPSKPSAFTHSKPGFSGEKPLCDEL